jgi:RNA polymerase sigma factor (sigma-70 family)
VTASDPTARAAIGTLFRKESPRVIASLTRLLRDVGLAEELAQDALVHALEQWPREGIPDAPGAWLMAAAKNRAMNHLRRGKMIERKHAAIGHELDERDDEWARDVEASLDDDVGDDLLRLIFTACHPVLSTEARVALTLRLLGGLTTEEIARAFLVPEATMAQRLVRAKQKLAEARVPFEVPLGNELAPRLASVLEVVYLVFNEGYAATAGDACLRPALSDEALRLGRLLAELAPREAEVHGLLALMEISASRANARTTPDGDPILLLEQDRTKWDPALIAEGLASLARAESLTSSRGPYGLQAAIAACHARAHTPDETDWGQIAGLYEELLGVLPSPVVALNHAVAVSMAKGPAAGLALLEPLRGEPKLAGYHLLPAARADLLAKLGRHDEARAEFERAAVLTRNARQRERLLARAGACRQS